MHETRLDQYLNLIGERLKRVSPERCAEELSEIRQHLEALIEGHKAMGCSPEEAIEAAIRQFGRAESIGQELKGALSNDPASPKFPLGLVTFSFLGGVALVYGFFTFITSLGDFPFEAGPKFILSILIVAAAFAINVSIDNHRERSRKRASKTAR